jgi:hypothetical protein
MRTHRRIEAEEEKEQLLRELPDPLAGVNSNRLPLLQLIKFVAAVY